MLKKINAVCMRNDVFDTFISFISKNMLRYYHGCLNHEKKLERYSPKNN